MTTVLITGINGFIGSYLSKYLESKGYRIIGLSHGKKTNYISCEKYFQCDLLRDNVIDILQAEKPDIIIHCAGSADVNMSVQKPSRDFEGNTMMVHKLLFAMKDCNLSHCKFVFLSSAAVYGQPNKLPIAEYATINPLSPYALHKYLSEQICLYFADNYGFDVKIARIFSAYGPGLKKQIFWDFHKKILENKELKIFGTGNESRDYIYIDDLTYALYLIIHMAPQDEHIYNVANGQEIFIRDVAYYFAEHNGVEKDKIYFDGIVREGNPLNWKADITKISSLGYIAETNIYDGIFKYIQWVNQYENS